MACALSSAQCGAEGAQNSNPLPQPTQRQQVTEKGRQEGGGVGVADRQSGVVSRVGLSGSLL